MRSDMTFQITRSPEINATVAAPEVLERDIIVVFMKYVLAQNFFVFELFIANNASISWHVHMQHFMINEATWLRKMFTARAAFIYLFTSTTLFLIRKTSIEINARTFTAIMQLQVAL
jgi:hypothetical protein